MPPINEGDLLYMPTTMPGISITEAKNILQQTDRIIRTFPEVENVFGKAGRAETATDPAPLSMIETTIRLKDRKDWRPGLTMEGLIRQMDEAVKFPGLSNSWGYPIKIRIDMLSTGIKTPIGLKITRPRPRGPEPPGDPGRSPLQKHPRDRQRLRRTHHRGLLPGFRHQAPGGGPLRPDRGGRPGRHPHRPGGR